MKRPGKVTLKTKEGVGAVKEAIEKLRGQTSLPPLRWSEDMSKATKDHVKDIGPKGLI